MTTPELSIIVPVYNEARTIVSVMEAIEKALPNAEIIYVNDGSRDESLDLMKKNARPLDIVLTKHNGGKGSAIRMGIEHAKGHWCVIQDADLEYDPAEILLLVEKAKHHPRSCIFGSRFLHANPNIYKLYLLGNKVLTCIANILFRGHLTDAYTCYKLFRTEILRSLPLSANGFEIEAELTAYPLLRKHPIIEVPITYKPRTFEEGKKINGKDAWRGIRTMMEIWWKN